MEMRKLNHSIIVTWPCAEDFVDAVTDIIIVDNLVTTINPTNDLLLNRIACHSQMDALIIYADNSSKPIDYYANNIDSVDIQLI